MELVKYPRTRHIAGSKLQPGDEDLSQVPITDLHRAHLVIEEKLDGANSAISFTTEGNLKLQSRGHFLSGGYREKHFAMLKTWAACHAKQLWAVLQNRYIMFGEWLYAKHTVYYDQLAHWFMEFDIWDRKERIFLSTPRRVELLAGSPVVSVPVVYNGCINRPKELRKLITTSLYKSSQWREVLADQVARTQLDHQRVMQQTDPENLAEGLYIKHEDDDQVLGRFKFIRASFLQSIIESDSHWLNRPIIPNRLATGTDIFKADD